MTSSDAIATSVPASATRIPVVLLLGPPGSGKGTQAERLSALLGVPSISTGEMIRAEIKAATPLGKIAAGVTITGGLLSDELVNRIVASRVSQPDCARGFMLDGYPRSLEQARYLEQLLAEKGLPQPTIVHVDVPHEHLVSRTCLRRFCSKCGHIYNLGSHPPRVEHTCDQCGARLQQRSDDCEDTVRNRLNAYDRTTAPLIQHYAAGDYHRVDGTGTPDEVFTQVKAVFES